MPELPEVETIARGLAPLIVGRRFTDLTVLDSRVFPGDQAAFRRDILDREIMRVFRRAKLLIVELADGARVAFHLKMTGRVFVAEPVTPPHKHLRVLLGLDGGRALHFQDMRRFGACRGFASGAMDNWAFYAGLGPEPLTLSPQDFASDLAGRSGRIKALLLDQRFVRGVGNIYADEALFRAGIHPMAIACRLRGERPRRLYESLRAVLTEAIAAGGSSISDYVDAQGRKGFFQFSHRVYQRTGEPCVTCGAPIRRVLVTQRSSHFCPQCQRR